MNCNHSEQLLSGEKNKRPAPLSLPLAEYRFTCRASDPVSLPALADPLWRSVFGLALRKLSCHGEKHSDCNGCRLRFDCDYAFLLMGFNRRQDRDGITRTMGTIPTPLIFRCSVQDYSVRVPPGSSFSVHLVVIGMASDRLSTVIRAMETAGSLGLGRRRARFSLEEVVQVGPQPLERLVMAGGEMIAPGLPAQVTIPQVPRTIRFSFLSPYLLPSSTDLDQGLGGAHLIMQIIRRISAMHEPYTGHPLAIDFRSLKELASTPFFLQGDLQAEPGYSYHANKKQFLAIRGGFLMNLSECALLWPWLYLGQWLGVGKQAGKGFGRYLLQEVTGL